MAASSPLLTVEQVKAWVAERAKVAAVFEESGRRLAALDAKLEALKSFLPEGTVDALLSSSGVQNPDPRAEWPFTDMVLDLLANWNGGLPPGIVRKRLASDPEVGGRVSKSTNGVSNALSRLYLAGKVVKVGNLYYHPDVYRLIESGEVKEEILSVEESNSFNSSMHALMTRYGRPFSASDALAAVQADPDMADRITENSNRVYSWLSREVYRKKLVRDGELYRYPGDENGAPPNKSAGAPDAGEVAASPIENRRGIRLVG